MTVDATRTHGRDAGTRSGKLTLGVALVAALVTAMLVPLAPAAGEGRKITFCHATNAATNPYLQITTDPASIIRRGHGAHTGPVFAEGMTSGGGWGDIIPPLVDLDFPGLNWTEEAQELCFGGGESTDVNAVFQGTKWLDSNGNGAWDPDERGIEDWDVTIYSVDGDDNRDVLETVTTDEDGEYFFQSPAVEDTAEHFVVCEEPQTGWRQTGPGTDAFDLAAGSVSGGAVVVQGTGTGEGMCYDVQTDGSSNATASFLDFFNVPEADLSGAKYFDANENGRNDSEAGIEGWPIEVVDAAGDVACALTTSATGDWSTEDCDLIPGTYTVREVQATNTAVWRQTGNTDANNQVAPVDTVTLNNFIYTFTLGNQPLTAENLFFGNACYVGTRPGGRTKGFWTNKNGEKTFNNVAPSTGLDAAGNLAGLVALNLVRPPNKHGVQATFDPTSYAEVKSFLNDANATDMRFMLSAQLAATWLNVNNGDRSPNLITDPGYSVTWTVFGTTAGTHTIAEWIVIGNDLLLTTNRTEQGRIKDLFDAINNNRVLGEAVGTIGTCAAPVF